MSHYSCLLPFSLFLLMLIHYLAGTTVKWRRGCVGVWGEGWEFTHLSRQEEHLAEYKVNLPSNLIVNFLFLISQGNNKSVLGR